MIESMVREMSICMYVRACKEVVLMAIAAVGLVSIID